MASGGIDDAQLVDAWAQASAHPAWRREPVLLSALGDIPAAEARALSIGAVAAGVLRLVRAWSPIGVEATLSCRACAAELAVTVPLEGLLSLAEPTASTTAVIEAAGRTLTVRAPRPDDLAAAAATTDAGSARRVLLSRCLHSTDDGLLEDESVAAAVAAAWEEIDPLGVVSLAIDCPACGAPDAPLVDLLGWGWAMVDARVHRLIDDVHRLASAYGWSEAEVLALGPWRRRAYLDLVQ